MEVRGKRERREERGRSFNQDVNNKEVTVLIRNVFTQELCLIIGLLALFEAIFSVLVGHAAFLKTVSLPLRLPPSRPPPSPPPPESVADARVFDSLSHSAPSPSKFVRFCQGRQNPSGLLE